MRYALKNYDEKTMARARLTDSSVSFKVAIEICNMIRNKPLEKAKKMLKNVIDLKEAVPYKRFNKDVGHKRAIGPGRYPQKASKSILMLLNTAESNAKYKGFGQDLIIAHLVANKGTDQWHYGRQRRRKMKRSHIEVAVKEREEGKPKKQVKQENQDALPHKEEEKESFKPIEQKKEEKRPTIKEEKAPIKKEASKQKTSAKPKTEAKKKK